MRIFGSHLTKASAIAFAGILGVAAFEMSPDVNTDYVPAPDSRVGFFRALMTSGQFSVSFKDQAAVILSDDSLRPDTSPVLGADDAALFLIATHKGRVVGSGSGTIIRGSHETHRVLTAFHVVDKAQDPEGSVVTAFSASGRAIAELKLVGSANRPLYDDLDSTDPRAVANDQSVLAVHRFVGEETQDRWNERGLPLARSQPENFMILAPAKADPSFSPGASGAGLRNGAGDVAGTLVISASLSVSPDEMDSTFLSLALEENEDAHKGLIQTIISRTKRQRFQDSVALAVPVVNPEILNQLGVNDVVPDPDIGAFRAEMVGFPSGEAVRSQAFASPLRRFKASDYASPNESFRP